MDDVRCLFLGMPHGITPAAVTPNKNIIMSSFKSSRDIQKKEGGPDSLDTKLPIMRTAMALTLRERLHTHKVFTKDQCFT